MKYSFVLCCSVESICNKHFHTAYIVLHCFPAGNGCKRQPVLMLFAEISIGGTTNLLNPFQPSVSILMVIPTTQRREEVNA